MPVAPLTLEWQSNAFDRFTVNDLYDVMRLRMAVFIGEQQCWYQDADGLDPSCLHLLGRLPSGKLACYLSFGSHRAGDDYLEDGILHVEMCRLSTFDL